MLLPTHQHVDDRAALEECSRCRVQYVLQSSHGAPEVPAGVCADDVLKEMEKYGNGATRSVREYEEWTGIDFARRTLSSTALSGGLPTVMFLGGFMQLIQQNTQ